MTDDPCSSNAPTNNGFGNLTHKEENTEGEHDEEQVNSVGNRLTRLEFAVERLDEKLEEQNETLDAICKHFNVTKPPPKVRKSKSSPQMSVEDLRIRKSSPSPSVHSGRVDKEAREKLVKDLRDKLDRKRKENDEFELTLVDLRKKVADLRKAVAEHPNNPVNKARRSAGEEEKTTQNNDTSN